MEKLNLKIEGMSCHHCVNAVRNRLEHTKGVTVHDVQVGSATMTYDPSQVTLDEIEDAIADEGYTADRG